MAGGTIRSGEDTIGLCLFLVLQLLFLTSLVPTIELRHELLVRGLASTPLDLA
jgi:hypothetical protein